MLVSSKLELDTIYTYITQVSGIDPFALFDRDRLIVLVVISDMLPGLSYRKSVSYGML